MHLFIDQDQVFDHKLVEEDVIHAVDTVQPMQTLPPFMKRQSTKRKRRISKHTNKSRSSKHKDRQRKRNQVMLGGALIGTAAVMLYLTKFYYSTHSTEDAPSANGGASAKSATIDFRKE